jgi:molybdate transport system substrate-binding protein
MKLLKYALFGLAAAAAVQSPAFAQAANLNNAPPNAIRVMVTAAIRGPLDAVMAQAQQALGKPIVARYGSARGNLKNEILAGQEFEIALLVPDVDAELLAAGKVKPGSAEIARAPIAIGIRGDVPANINLKTTAGVRRALVGAKGVKYAPTGAALFTVRKIISTLRLQNEISDISAMRGTLVLAPGEYEINIYPLSEIIPNQRLHNMGVVIPALQVPADITATVGANTRDEAGARALIAFLRGPAIDPTLEPNGMIKGRRNR